MPAGSRKPPLIVLAVVLAAGLLALGMWLGGHPEDLPGFLAQAFVADSETRAVDQAIDTVAGDYYRPVGRRALARASIEGMLASLHDPYSTYLSAGELRRFDEPPTFTGIGVSVAPTPLGLRIERVFDRSPAARTGIQPGEVIVAANGRRLAGLPESAAVALVKGPPGSSVTLTIAQGRRRRSVRVMRATISAPVVASGMRTVGGVKLGRVYLAEFSEEAHQQLASAVRALLHRGARGLVLDLRGNGGGLVSEARLVASLFLRSGVIVTTRGRNQPTSVLRASGQPLAPSLPMVVLVDRQTASAAEIVTGALQDHRRAAVVGTHTYGKGVFQELAPLQGGGGIKLTVGHYFTPNGRNLGGGGVSQGAGIAPEVPVRGGVDGGHGLDVAFSVLAARVRAAR